MEEEEVKIDATVFIFVVVLGFILINSKWFAQQLVLVTDIVSSGIKELQQPS